MSDAITSVLSQIKSLQSLISPSAGAVNGISAPAQQPGFAQTLQQTVSKVNASQVDATNLQSAYEFGDPNVDLVRVMLASQQAQIGFRATVEVRNKLVQAYQEVMNMPL